MGRCCSGGVCGGEFGIKGEPCDIASLCFRHNRCNTASTITVPNTWNVSVNESIVISGVYLRIDLPVDLRVNFGKIG